MPEDEHDIAPRTDYCDRKRRFYTKKAARRKARTAGKRFERRFFDYFCVKHACFHLATAATRQRPPPKERTRGAPTPEREERARANTRAVVKILDERKEKENQRMSSTGRITMTPVKSSNVRAYGFQPPRGPLRLARIIVQFDGGVYECVRHDGDAELTERAWDAFVAAPSKGSWYDQNIKKRPDVWAVRKLEEAAAAAQLAPKADEEALARAIAESKADKEVEHQIAATRYDTSRDLAKTLAEMLAVVPEGESALRARLEELHDLVVTIVEEANELPAKALWRIVEEALRLHIGEPEQVIGDAWRPWMGLVWQTFRGFGPMQNVYSSETKEAGKAARHQFVKDFSKQDTPFADFCLECSLPRKHPVHFVAGTGQGDAQESPHSFHAYQQTLVIGSDFAVGMVSESCTRCGQPRAHPVHEKSPHSCKAYAGNRTLLLTVGLPRSGKTTWARKTGFPIVSPDAIRLALHGQAFEPLAEPFVWAIARIMVRALFLAGHETVILDACSVTRARRDEWRGGEWETFVVMFECSREEARRRVLADIPENSADTESGRLLEAIDRMAKSFEPLGEDEAVWAGVPLLFNIPELHFDKTLFEEKHFESVLDAHTYLDSLQADSEKGGTK